MRDYRTISASKFLAECIEMKLRWLARQLRRVDKPAEIEAWVSSVTAVTNLLWKIKDQQCVSNCNGQAARGNIFMKDGRIAEATKLVKDTTHIRTTNRTERCDISDTNRMEEDETVVLEHVEEDVQTQTRRPSLHIETSTNFDSFKPTEESFSCKLEVAAPIQETYEGLQEEETTELEKNLADNGLLKPETNTNRKIVRGRRTLVQKKEVDGRKGRRKKRKILIEWWRRALLRKLQEEGKEHCYWRDKDNFIRLVTETAEDRILIEKIKDRFPKEFPVGSSFQVIPTLGELHSNLWDAMFDYFKGKR